MLITLMYHKIGKGKHSNTLPLFQEHLQFLQDNYRIVLPGDPLKGMSVCLTFDDATYDFYHYVFPLLKALKMRAVLGVPVRYILDDTALSPQKRLEVPYTLAMQDDIFDTKAPFCTWKELQEMVNSGLVEIASHSYFHKNLTRSFVNLDEELVVSKQVLEARLAQPISTFIYPFGRWNARVHASVRKTYRYAFRIGSSMDFDWGDGIRPLHRIPADNLSNPRSLLSFSNKARFFLKALFA